VGAVLDEKEHTMRRLLALAAVLGVTAVGAGSAYAGNGPPHLGFYVDGAVYRTVGTPTDFSGTGAPDASFDTLYEFSGAQALNVATAAPGDQDYNGGRWRVQVLGFPQGYDAALASGDENGNGVIDSDAELALAFADGTALVTGAGPSFECPVIPLRGSSA
jgi:hypothetical protein